MGITNLEKVKINVPKYVLKILSDIGLELEIKDRKINLYSRGSKAYRILKDLEKPSICQKIAEIVKNENTEDD